MSNSAKIDIKINIDSRLAEKRMRRATKAAIDLQNALDNLNGANIHLNVTDVPSKNGINSGNESNLLLPLSATAVTNTRTASTSSLTCAPCTFASGSTESYTMDGITLLTWMRQRTIPHTGRSLTGTRTKASSKSGCGRTERLYALPCFGGLPSSNTITLNGATLHVICRDLDSISTYREAQMVKQWIQEDKAIHCITDSVSHDVAMLGGLCGFRPGYLNDILKLTNKPDQAFNKLMDKGRGIDFNVKGSDQRFLNDYVYNTDCCKNATEHFIKGRSHDKKEENGRHYSIDESIDIGVPDLFKATNLFAGHAGAAGFYEIPTLRFLSHYDPYRKDYEELQNLCLCLKQIFYWNTREDLVLSGFKE